MNERIKELWDEAWDDNTPLGIIRNKFAELIVRECAELCMKKIDTGLLMAPQSPEMAKQILQHFGVEISEPVKERISEHDENLQSVAWIEREACAKLCDELANNQTNQSLLDPSDCAKAIRARSNHE